MRSFSFLIFLLGGLYLSSCDLLEDIFEDDGLSNQEVVNGLREALRVGTDSAVARTTRTDGFFRDELIKVALPLDVINGLDVIKSSTILRPIYESTLASVEEDLILAINRSAENAATKAGPIFRDAISSITIQDGFDILNGDNRAATAFLASRTSQSLKDTFEPDIDDALNTPLVLGLSANVLYERFITNYNAIAENPIVTNPLSPINIPAIETQRLAPHVSDRAIDGLFVKVGEEEENIRNNPTARVTQLLERVFGSSNN
ncbi:MAG: DUF4197 domain-containing protein [Cyclobacteriaceae bacterium]|nr:DUF4197 domain-containing protein [Cyclobacteriaceae bacterium]MCH8515433.1 DUF4197 domain-containing protein [Cyclobacteriaceae bacterium]